MSPVSRKSSYHMVARLVTKPAARMRQLGRPEPRPAAKIRSAPAIVFSGPAQRSLMLWPARSRSRQATLSIESSGGFVASAAVSIATGWSEPVPGRELHPLKSSALPRRTFSPNDRRGTDSHPVAAAKRARSPAFQHWDPRGLFPRVFLRAGELSGAGDNARPDSTLAFGPRLLTRPRPKVHISENRVRADGARPALSYTISSDRHVVCRDILHASTPCSRLWSYLRGRTIVIPGGDEWNWAAVRIGGLRIHGDGLKRVR
jgi:hypothetical protein